MIYNVLYLYIIEEAEGEEGEEKTKDEDEEETKADEDEEKPAGKSMYKLISF